MFKSISNKLVLSVTASVFLLSACDKSDDEAGKATALSTNTSILQYIPADSPYVLVNAAPLPNDLMDKLEPKLERLMQSYQVILKEVISQQQAKRSEERQDSDEAQRLNAFIDELVTLMSVQGMRDAGIGRDATGALYGNGLLPVARVTLSDSAAFENAITRLEQSVGDGLATAVIGEQSYRYFDFLKLRIVIAIVDEQAVFTLLPTEFNDTQTAQVLGLTLPETSIADTGVLQEIAVEYGFTDHYVGYMDVTGFVDRFIGDSNGLDADLFAIMGEDAPEYSDVCRAEIRSLAGIAPRLVMGYTSISMEKFESTVAIEFREDIAAGLQALPGAVPGLGQDLGGLFSFGISMNFKTAREFAEARLDAMEAEPFACEYFAKLQDGVANGRETLSQPVPPMIYDFQGFLSVIDEIEGLDVATQTPPTKVDGSFLLAMNHAQALVSLGAMFSPDLAQLDLQTDGKAVAVDLPQMQEMDVSTFAAMTENAIAVSVGEGAEEQVASLLNADFADPAPLLSFSMDAARYYSFLAAAMEAGPRDAENAPSAEMQAAMNDIMLAVADIYQRMSGNVYLTPRGMEIETTVTLQE